MIGMILKRLQVLWGHYATTDTHVSKSELKASKNEELAISSPYSTSEKLVDDLNTSCSTITIYMREDGEFAVTTEFNRNDEQVMDVTGTILHMLNSGLLADYFLQSLHFWANEHPQDTILIRDIIKQWKVLFDEEENADQALAVDPSEVFSLKSFSAQGEQ